MKGEAVEEREWNGWRYNEKEEVWTRGKRIDVHKGIEDIAMGCVDDMVQSKTNLILE